jgi:hypothetical protein
MRRIALRRVILGHLGRELGVLDYGELIGNIVAMPACGVRLAEMAVPVAIMRLVAAADRDGGAIELDEAQWVLLVRRLTDYRFPLAAEVYQEFARAILQAERYDLEETPAMVPRAVA